MKSVLATKLTRTQMAFKDQVTHCKGDGDMDFLKQFVEDYHKNAEFHPKDANSIEVYTTRSSYLYTCFPKYIRQINLENNERAFFKIS